MKFFLPIALFAAFAFSACNTLENRRSFYSTQKVHGPYTRQLEEGTWGNPKTVDEQYAETKTVARRPKLIEQKPVKSAGEAAPAAGVDAALPR